MQQKQIYKKHGQTPLSEIIAKLKSNDPAFKELNLQEIEYNVTLVEDCYEVSQFTDEALSELAAAIQENKTVKSFKYKGLTRFGNSTDWTHVGAEAIGNAFKDHPALEEIHLPFDQKEQINTKQTEISSAEMSGFLQALSGKAKIKNLYLTANLTDDVLSSLGKSLAGNTTLECMTIVASVGYHEPKHTDDALMTFASGFAGKSLQHLTLKLKLNDASIEIISQHLSKSNTLKTMTLNRCNITSTSMISIATILKENKHLTDLDLSSNSLDLDSIKSLAGTLPNLPRLKSLLLNDTNLDYMALDELAKTWKKFNLKIRTLEIGMPFHSSSDYIAALKKIIENNKYLKNLTIPDSDFQEEQFDQLKDLLQDPNKCRLQEFIFGGLQGNDDFNNSLINTLERNPNLTKLTSLYSPPSLTAAWRKNVAIQKNSQQLFIKEIISFSMCFSPPKNDKLSLLLSQLPVDVFILILNQLGRQEPLGMNPEDMVQCARLIFDNFSTRRKLINEKKYSPIKGKNSNSKAEVSKWWSLSPREDNSKPIFRQRTIEDSKVKIEAVDAKQVKPSTKCSMM